MKIRKLGILISGRGSNMRSIVNACRDGRVPAEVAIVVSNRADAPGLAWAASQGLPTAVLSHKDYPSRQDHDTAILQHLRTADVDYVCLAGYMRLLSSILIDAYPSRILNIHPSLLPAFPGLNSQQQACDHGVRVSGCTVHLVDVELDHGPIVVQRTVPVLEHDNVEDLSKRILEQEHVAYPEALEQLLTRPWTVEGRKVVFITRNHSC